MSTGTPTSTKRHKTVSWHHYLRFVQFPQNTCISMAGLVDILESNILDSDLLVNYSKRVQKAILLEMFGEESLSVHSIMNQLDVILFLQKQSSKKSENMN